jgi:hypothetical protein
MSQRDIEQNKATLDTFKGLPCFATLATNSIKFRIGDSRKKGRYIWIDPPWVFSRDWQEITSSDAYSDDSFREWCGLFSLLRETILEDFNEGEDGSLTLLFPDGYRLFIPGEFESDQEPDSDYDHWYAYDEKASAQL